MVSMNKLWGGGVITSIREYCSLRIHWYYHVTFFTPPNPYYLPTFSCPLPSYPNPKTLTLSSSPGPYTHHTIPQHSAPGSYFHLDIAQLPLYVCRLHVYSILSDAPRPRPVVLIAPYKMSLLACSLVPPLSSHLSTTVVSPSHHPIITCLDTLSHTSQILSHAPLIACPMIAYLYFPPLRHHICYSWLVCGVVSVPFWYLFLFCVSPLGLCVSTTW